MPLVKAEGVVLQSRRFSESSKILSIFTREKGRVTVLVKGGRKGPKKFPGGLETLNRIELQYYHRGGREMQNFKSADLLESHPRVRKDLKRTYTALSLAETVLRCTAPEDANADLFDHLRAFLAALERTESNPWTIRWASLLRICRSLGFGLSLDGCSRCGSGGPMRSFSFDRGGFICATCHTRESSSAGGFTATSEIWGILRFLNNCPLEISPRMIVNPAAGKKIEALFLRYFKYHIPGLKNFASWKALPQVYWGET